MGKDFVFRWEVDKVSEITNSLRDSPTHYYANLPWNLSVRKTRVDTGDSFSIFLTCNEDSAVPLWSVYHYSTIILVHRQNTDKNKTTEVVNCFDNDHTSWGRIQIIPDVEIMDVEKGYIQDDKVLLEAHVSVEEVHGIKELVEFDFSQPQESSDNAILRVEGETFHVSKGYLSTQSPFFSALFYKEFKEKNQSEIELGDVTAQDFINFLQITFPTNKPLTVDTYKSVLDLADRFRVQCALDKVEKYLINSKKVEIHLKLLLADQYRLEELKMHCLNSITTVEAVKAIEKTKEFKKYSGSLNTLLLKKVLSLSK